MSSRSKRQSDDPTHAGGVVYRAAGDHVEYLLVRSTGPLREWVLPKGHIEADEGSRDAAIREVDEEAGVRAEVVDELDTIEYSLRGHRVRVLFYLMKALPEDAEPGTSPGRRENRQRKWLPLEEAQVRLTHETYRQLLGLAERRRRGG